MQARPSVASCASFILISCSHIIIRRADGRGCRCRFCCRGSAAGRPGQQACIRCRLPSAGTVSSLGQQAAELHSPEGSTGSPLRQNGTEWCSPPDIGCNPAGRYRSLAAPFHLYYAAGWRQSRLIFQLIQRTQQRAAVRPLSTKMPAARYLQTRCGSRLPSSHAVPEVVNVSSASGAGSQRNFLRCSAPVLPAQVLYLHLRAGRCGESLRRKGGPLRLVPATFQDLHPGRGG